MRMLVVIFMLVLSSCASNQKAYHEYSKIRNFQVGKTTEEEVLKVLGSPTVRLASENFYLFHYNDPATDYQRLSISFQPNNRVRSILWIPKETEVEYSLEGAKASFKNSFFKEVAEQNKNPHAFGDQIVSYIDEKYGITIRYDKRSKSVEAIAFYNPDVRVPAKQRTEKSIPYKL